MSDPAVAGCDRPGAPGEQGGTRPVLVVPTNPFNAWPVGLVIVVPSAANQISPQMWGDAANDTIGEFYGLQRLAIVAFSELPRHGTRKLGAIAGFVGERAMAWVDDEIYDDARQWADQRSASTLLIRTVGSVGLRPEHYDQLKRFASDLAAAPEGCCDGRCPTPSPQ